MPLLPEEQGAQIDLWGTPIPNKWYLTTKRSSQIKSDKQGPFLRRMPSTMKRSTRLLTHTKWRMTRQQSRLIRTIRSRLWKNSARPSSRMTLPCLAAVLTTPNFLTGRMASETSTTRNSHSIHATLCLSKEIQATKKHSANNKWTNSKNSNKKLAL